MARFERVKVALALHARSPEEAEAVASALAADDASDSCSKVSTRRDGERVVIEIECWCPSPLARARSLADDVLRSLGAIHVLQGEGGGAEMKRKA